MQAIRREMNIVYEEDKNRHVGDVRIIDIYPKLNL